MILVVQADENKRFNERRKASVESKKWRAKETRKLPTITTDVDNLDRSVPIFEASAGGKYTPSTLGRLLVLDANGW